MSVHDKRLTLTEGHPVPPDNLDETDPLLEFWKELINKSAWALGTTYQVEYSAQNTPVRAVAKEMAILAADRLDFPQAVKDSLSARKK